MAEEWSLGGEPCTREAYDAAVPAEEEQSAGLLLRNLLYEEYQDDIGLPANTFVFPQDGAALSYDGMVAYLRALPTDFVTWVAMPNAWGDNRPVLLPFYGLYNVAEQEGWFSCD